MIKSLTTAQATRIAGFKSPMMVDYLCRAGIVVPSVASAPGRGRPRLYNFGDIVLLRAVRRLLDAGLPVSRLRQGLETQRRKFSELSTDTVIARYLITDGCNVILHDDPSKLVELNKDGQMVFAFIIDIQDARAEVSGKVEKFSRRTSRFPKEIRKRSRKTAKS